MTIEAGGQTTDQWMDSMEGQVGKKVFVISPGPLAPPVDIEATGAPILTASPNRLTVDE